MMSKSRYPREYTTLIVAVTKYLTRNNRRKQGFVVGKAAVRSHEGGKSHYSDSHKSDSQ